MYAIFTAARVVATGALVLALGLLPATASRGVGYLELCGPAGLRFSAATRPEKKAFSKITLPPLKIITPESGERAVAPVAIAPLSPTNELIETQSPDHAASLLPDVFSGINRSSLFKQPDGGAVTNAGPSVSAASDLLVITPQMLLEYFKTSLRGTNGAATRVSAPVEFTPPIQPSYNSQAVYRSQ